MNVIATIAINLQWDHCYSNNCDEMSKFEVSNVFILINLQWDDCYSNICDETVWVRASVISDKSSMRWLL